MNRLAKLYVQLVLNAQDYMAGLRGLASRSAAQGAAIGQAFGRAFTRAIQVAAVATAAILGGITATGVKSAVSFEQALSSVQAISGATDATISRLKDTIGDIAVDPGLNASALEAAQAAEVLARNGLDMQLIMDSALRATVQLSNAVGTTFKKAADVATDVVHLFGVDLAKAVDSITGIVNNTKFSFDDFRLALAQSGGVASLVGVTFEDLATAIGGIAPVFSSGSDAGTSLRVFFQRLIPTTKIAINEMKRLGLLSIDMEKLREVATGAGLSDAEFNLFGSDMEGRLKAIKDALGETEEQFVRTLSGSGAFATPFFDELGEFEGMQEAVESLVGSVGDVSSRQALRSLTDIFGTDAVRAAAALAGLDEGAFLKLFNEINRESSAAETAATRLENVAGAWENFRETVEFLSIEAAFPFLSEMRYWILELAAAMQDKIPEVRDWSERMARLLELFREAEQIGGFEFAMSGLLKALGLDQEVIDQISQFTKMIMKVVDFVNEHQEEFALGAKAIAAGLTAIGIAAKVSTFLTLLLNPISLVTIAIAGLGLAWITNMGDIQEKTKTASGQISEDLKSIWEAIQETRQFQETSEVVSSAWDGIVEAAEEIDWSEVSEAWDDLKESLERLWIAAKPLLWGFVKLLLIFAKLLVDWAVNKIPRTIKAVKNAIKIISGLADILASALFFGRWLAETIRHLLGLEKDNTKLKSLGKSMAASFDAGLSSIGEGFFDDFDATLGGALTRIAENTAANEELNGKWNEAGQTLSEALWEGFMKANEEGNANMWAMVQETFADEQSWAIVRGSINEKSAELQDAWANGNWLEVGREAINMIWQGVTDVWPNFVDAFTSAAKSVWDAIQGIFSTGTFQFGGLNLAGPGIPVGSLGGNTSVERAARELRQATQDFTNTLDPSGGGSRSPSDSSNNYFFEPGAITIPIESSDPDRGNFADYIAERLAESAGVPGRGGR